jgi:hypothetical protein
MMDMPNQAEIEQQFGSAQNQASRLRSIHREQLDAEARGRHMREAQVAENCAHTATVPCPLTGAGTGQAVVTQRIDFGRLLFTDRPRVAVGPRLVGAIEGVFGCGSIADDTWETDAKGFYRAVSVFCGYLGTPIAATVVHIDFTFTGPALRGA